MKIKNAVTGVVSVVIALATVAVMLLLIQPVSSGIERGLATPDMNAQPTVSYTTKLYLPVISVPSKLYLPVVSGAPIETLYGVEMPGISDGTGLAQIRAAGASWIKLAGVWWPDVEPQQGVRNWAALAAYDASLANVADKQMNVILVVRGTPIWAQLYPPYSCGPITPAKLGAFGDFMYELVRRYSVPPYNVHYWEIGNEPDIDRALVATNSLIGCWGDSNDANYGGGYYATMLKTVYPRIKQADSTAQVLVGGLLLDCDPTPPLNPSYGCKTSARAKPPKFLAGILANGGAPYFDGIAFNSYDYFSNSGVIGAFSNTNWNSASNTNGSAIIAKTRYIASLLSSYSVTGKYIINTEAALLCGWCAGGGVLDSFETTKAFLVAQIYASGIVSDLKAVTWFRSIDGSAYNVSLLNDDLSPRKAYTAFLTSRYTLEDGTYERTLSTSDVGGVTGVKGYSFLVNGQRVWTLWSTDAQPKLITLPQMPSGATNMLGVNIAVSPSRQLQLTAPDSLFAYIHWNP